MARTPTFFSPAEAAAAIPDLRPILARLRASYHEYVFAKAQVDELVSTHGESLDSRGHPLHDEAQAWRTRASDLAGDVESLLAEANALGADVKDPILGLVDFYHRRADGSIVLLCYRDDEPALAWWHPLETGFAGRRPLSEL